MVTLTVEIKCYPPLAPASLHLVEEPDTLVLELHKVVECDGHQITFHSYGSRRDESCLAIEGTYIFRQWWNPDQLALAQNKRREWEKHRFIPLDAVEVSLGGAAQLLRPLQVEEDGGNTDSLVQKGWDHEHCALCWQRISAYAGDQATGYSSDDEWICEACYERYIKSGFGEQLGD